VTNSKLFHAIVEVGSIALGFMLAGIDFRARRGPLVVDKRVDLLLQICVASWPALLAFGYGVRFRRRPPLADLIMLFGGCLWIIKLPVVLEKWLLAQGIAERLVAPCGMVLMIVLIYVWHRLMLVIVPKEN